MRHRSTEQRERRVRGGLPLYIGLAVLVLTFVGAAWIPWRPAIAKAPVGGAHALVASEDPFDDNGSESQQDELVALLERAHQAEEALKTVESAFLQEVAPIERVLLTYRDDPELARRIAVSLVREARRAGLEPRMLLAVLLVENPWLEPKARSFVGAVGLMQVMPLHKGQWRACEPNLEAVESNICHGAQIFAHYLRRSGGDPERALLRYNGCVNGTNTPNCHRYPYHVYARAGRASMLAWLGQPARGGAAAP